MRTAILIFGLIMYCSCNKSTESIAAKLLRTEATSYTGDVFYTEYSYDNGGRITSISTHKNNEPAVVGVTIAYNQSEVSLLSHPETDPTYNQTKEVHLTLDANGNMLKRIEFTHAVAKSPAVQASEKFSNDTVRCAYDASGFLSKATESRYDSTWADSAFYAVSSLTSSINYTMDAGNLIKTDQYAVYPLITSRNGIITVSGGSSEYHNQFKYSKSFPNRTDFKNTAVLNEYALYYEPFLNINYKNMPDQVIRNSEDRDMNNGVIFTGNSTIDIERVYNSDGLLSTVNITSHNAAYTTINYIYGR